MPLTCKLEWNSFVSVSFLPAGSPLTSMGLCQTAVRTFPAVVFWPVAAWIFTTVRSGWGDCVCGCVDVWVCGCVGVCVGRGGVCECVC